jgi:hypothetical protein
MPISLHIDLPERNQRMAGCSRLLLFRLLRGSGNPHGVETDRIAETSRTIRKEFPIQNPP